MEEIEGNSSLFQINGQKIPPINLNICFNFTNKISHSSQIGTKLMHGYPTISSKSARFSFNAIYISK
jgi:hypothetical protein